MNRNTIAGCVIDVRMSTADIASAKAKAGSSSGVIYEQEKAEKLASHLDDCRSYAAEQDWPVLAEFSDNAISGSPQFRNKGQILSGRNSALEVLRSRKGDHVVFLSTEIARLYRSTNESRELIDVARQLRYGHGGLLVACTDGRIFDLSSVEGESDFNDAVNKAQRESGVVSVRRLRKERRRANAGGYWGTEPFGYHKVYTPYNSAGQRFYIAPWLVPCDRKCENPRHTQAGEADIIEAAARMLVADPRHSMAAITRHWDEQGIRTRNGKKWTQGMITALFRNKLYNGVRVHRAGHPIDGRADRRGRGTETPGAWSATLDDGLFMAVQGILNDPDRRENTAADSTRRHLLSGLAVHEDPDIPPEPRKADGTMSVVGKYLDEHPDCGGILKSHPGPRGSGRQYACPVPPLGCGRCRRSEKTADRWVIKQVLHWLQPGGLYAKYAEQAESEHTAKSARSRTEQAALERTQWEEAQALKGYRDVLPSRKGASLVALLDEIDATEERMAERAAQLAALAEGNSAPAGSPEAYQELKALLLSEEPATLADRHAVIARYVDRVVFKAPGQGTRRVFDPSTIIVEPGAWWAGGFTREEIDASRPAVPGHTGHTRDTILGYLREHPGSTPREIAEATGHPHPVICMAAKKLRDSGEVTPDRIAKRGDSRPIRYTLT